MAEISQIYVSVDGADTNAGTELDTPLRTIMAASAKAEPGTMVLIAPGVYAEQLTDLAGGDSNHRHVIYQALDMDQPPVIRPDTGNRPLLLSTAHLTVRGLILDAINCRYDAVKITRSGTQAARDVSIIDCIVRNGYENGVLVTGKSSGVRDITISHCRVHDNGRAGTRFFHGVYVATDYVHIMHCEIYRNGGWGIHTYGETSQPSYLTIDNNHVHHNGHADPLESAAGIGCYYGYEIRLSGNEVHDNPQQVVFNTGIGGPP